MNRFQGSKALVLEFYEILDGAADSDITEVLSNYTSTDLHWRGMHPFYEQYGAEAVANSFWRPLRRALTSLQRRMDLFMAGKNHIDGGESEWVCSMGHLMGLFDENWLGIPSTGKLAFLRYVEFHRITKGKISETALFVDIIDLIKQAGIEPLPIQTGVSVVTPGPRTHNGLMYSEQDPAESEKTLNLINRMCDELTGSDMESSQDELLNTWHRDMIWWGPAGIGATYTCPRYQKQHQGPFSDGLADITFNGHIARFAEGEFGAWFGWPNLTMTPSGGFMGLPANDTRVNMRVVDVYRREGDKLAENWIFIDMLYFLQQQGLDVLARIREVYNTRE